VNHIDQEAELYALGMLDDDERARIDDHAATCAECAARLGRAEAAVAALADAANAVPRRRSAPWGAIAAAFALAAGGLLWQNFTLRGALAADGTVLATLVNSHFDHMQFRAPGGAALGAKTIYERHGAWYEILADGMPDWHVTLIAPDGSRRAAAGSFERRGAASVLLFAPVTPVRTIELDDSAGNVVAVVTPVLEAPNR
jgi:hypothetical protein